MELKIRQRGNCVWERKSKRYVKTILETSSSESILEAGKCLSLHIETLVGVYFQPDDIEKITCLAWLKNHCCIVWSTEREKHDGTERAKGRQSWQTQTHPWCGATKALNKSNCLKKSSVCLCEFPINFKNSNDVSFGSISKEMLSL